MVPAKYFVYLKSIRTQNGNDLKSEVAPNIHRPAKKQSTFLTCVYMYVLKPVNPCSCFGCAINDFGTLFSARQYKVTLEIKIFRFAPETQLQLLWFFNPGSSTDSPPVN